MTNQEFAERAAITTDKLVAAGKLNPEQANKFVDYVYDLSVLRNMVRLERFTPDELQIDKIGVGSRVAVPKAEAVDPAIRRSISTSRVSLTPVDIMVPFEIGDRFKRFNIEGDDVEDHIIRMMAAQLANDLDILWLGGLAVGPAVLQSEILDDGSSTQYVKDSYLALFNGFLKLAESGNVVDMGNAAIGASVYNKALLGLPVKYRRRRDQLKYMLSPDHEQAYREGVSGRATPLGDNALQSQQNLTPFGIELMPVPLLERNPLYAENSVANTDGTTPTALTYKPISDLVIVPTTIAATPIDAYVEGAGNDYTEDLTNGEWTRLTGGNIGSGATVRTTYRSRGKMMLTDPRNLIIGLGLDITIERDRNIFRGVNEFAITVSVAAQIENVDAVVLATNIADPTL